MCVWRLRVVLFVRNEILRGIHRGAVCGHLFLIGLYSLIGVVCKVFSRKVFILAIQYLTHPLAPPEEGRLTAGLSLCVCVSLVSGVYEK